MLIVYTSMTGKVREFINKTGLRAVDIEDIAFTDEPFIFVTYTIGFGEVPGLAQDFLNDEHENMVAVAVSGNKIWGQNYGKAGDLISEWYNVPLLMKFELSGTNDDVKKFLIEVEKWSTLD